ncbi:hypothetical protein M422DRAFT_238534 [Sphaerobolus stellatus SS14]|nr:hypothetical protein M422DRAFT_238534 [Sphaerobolus stellatus SS14]
MVAFSRLQLAAALLEYDNDPDDPNPPKKAEESAIFSHLRTRNAPRAKTLNGFEQFRETPNLLGVELPISDAASGRGSIDARRSIANTTRTSRALSVDLLRNPFGGEDLESERADDDDEYEQYEEEEIEVDLDAWGMSDFLGNKEKDKQNSKKQRAEKRARRVSKAQSEMLLSTSHSASRGTDEFGRLGSSGHLPQGTRSKSMGGLGGLPDDIQALRGGLIASEADFRRRTLSGPMDIMGRQTPDFAQRSRPPIDRNQTRSATPHGASPLQIPFPTQEQDEDYRSTFELPLNGTTSRFDPKSAHMRTVSNGSLGSTVMLGGQDPARQTVFSQDEDAYAADAFAVASDRASRFDPRPSMDNRRMSRASIGGTIGGTQALEDENPFSLPPPSPTRTSRFDPKAVAYTRTMSDASLGSRLPPDADRMSIASGQLLDAPPQPRRLSRHDLLRPKVLIMPSPLQDLEAASVPPPADVPVGFHKTIIGPPLPPGAKGNSNTLTPNPRQALSLAQITFRNSLMTTTGQRDPTFNDIERNLRRAEQDGEQIYQEEDIEEELAEEQKQAQGRAAGKLYGRSLMDELEARKEKLRSKQRVFTGDQRPSMMSRGNIRRSSTLIDPATLNDRPASQAFPNGPGLSRKGSLNSKPLLNFSNEVSPGEGAKSVFGPDQIWERELLKLKEIEAIEKAAEDERRQHDDKKAARKAKKSKKKGGSPVQDIPISQPQVFERPVSRLPELPPTLPNIPQASRKPRPPVDESDSEPDSEASEREAKRNAARLDSKLGGWGSSDDEKKVGTNRVQPRVPLDDDSEDDVPLAQVLQNPPALRLPESDSEDEQPLSKVLERKSTFFPNTNLGSIYGQVTNDDGDGDEDEMPLGLKHPRASAFLSQSIAGGDEEDDDKPLALKQMERQQGHQVQQGHFGLMGQPPMMMMQPQMTGSMVFGAPSMMSGFTPFGMPVMAPPMFNMPQQAPIVPDAAKYASVDRWRRDVAAE